MKGVGEYLTAWRSRSGEIIGTWLNLAFSPVFNLYRRSGLSRVECSLLLSPHELDVRLRRPPLSDIGTPISWASSLLGVRRAS